MIHINEFSLNENVILDNYQIQQLTFIEMNIIK